MLVLRLVAGLLQPRLSFSKLSKALSSGKVSESATVANFQNFVPKHVSDENTLSIMFAGAGLFKTIFFGSFCSVPSFGINSSVNLGMPFRVYSAELFGNEIPLPTLLNNELCPLFLLP